MPKKLNWDIITSNVAEARKQLEQIEARIAGSKPPNLEEFQIMMQHAYLHLNFAWNARHQPTQRYAQLTAEDFQEWGKLPSDLEFEE
jgi:hypothetical protein